MPTKSEGRLESSCRFSAAGSRRTRAQAGFSLAEITTALAVFAIIFVAALLLYDRSNRVFSQNTQAAEMQQGTRVAYEKLVQDIRLAGFDYKRAGVPTSAYPVWKASNNYSVGQMIIPSTNNGYIYQCSAAGTSAATAPGTWNATVGGTTTESTGVVWTNAGVLAAAFDQPDEQIEYAWSSAITVRANYDYDILNDSVHYDHGREANLESTKFPVVTTGNDEIVTYALVSTAPGAANSDTIDFFADVNSSGSPSRRAYPGGTAERTVTIDGVDLSNANPPYTLYRFTLASNGSVVRTPMAENIRSLTFNYWEDQKATAPLNDVAATPAPITDVGGDGQYNPAFTSTANAAGRRIRAKIRAVTVTLVGMNPVADNDYTDADTAASHYRKMTLATTIVPRNLGIRTLPQTATQAPPSPTNVTVCHGYCGIALVSWSPGDPSTLSSTGSNGAESFAVVWDTATTGDFSHWLPAGQLTTYGADLTQEDLTQDYYFRVAASNSVGTSFSDIIGPISLKNDTKPATPGLTATGSYVSGSPRITLAWSTPVTNASGSPSCSSGSTTVATFQTELQGYRIYRRTSSGTPTAANLLIDVGGAGPVPDGAGNWTYADTTVTECTQYYYYIQAVEWCTAANQNSSGNASDGVSDYGSANTSVSANPAATPTGLYVDATSNCNWTTNVCTPVMLKWTKVTTDTSGTTVNIDSYDVYRRKRKNATTLVNWTNVATLTNQAAVASPISWSEPAALTDHDTSDNGQYFYDYYVIAKSNCGDSTASSTVTFPNVCNSLVTISAVGAWSGLGTSASPWIGPTSIHLNAGSNAIVAAWVSLDGGSFTSMASPWQYAWSDNDDGTNHTLTFTVQVGSPASCVETLSTVHVQNSTPGCHLTTGAASVLSTTTVPTGYTSTSDYAFNLKIQNLIPGTSLTLSKITIQATLPTKIGMNGVKFPSQSGGTYTANSPSCAPISNAGQTCTSQFSVPAADNTVAGSGTKTVVLLLKKTGSPSAPTSSVFTSVTVTYTEVSTGNSYTCTIAP